MARLLRRLWSLGWLLVLLAGVPAGLVRLVGWPLPDHWPTAGEWQVWLARPLTRTTLLDGAAIIGWLLWAVLVYAVVVEVLTRARRVVRALARLRLPTLPTPLQATASGMLGAAVFGMPTGSAHPPAPPVAPPPATSLLPATADTPVVMAEPGAPARPPALAGHPTIGERDPDLRGRGVALPDGGWVTGQTAHAIASAAAVVWWRRRRDYTPRPPTGAVRDDADLAPLPPVATTVQDVLRGRERPDDAEDPGGAAHGAGGVVPVEPPPAAEAADRAGRPIGPGDLPAGGVGLTGTGAFAAARGIAAAVLLSAGPWQHAGFAQLITTGTDLHTLLGPAAAGHHATPGLTVVDGLDDAIALLEQRTLTRARQVADNRPAADHQGPPPDAGFPPVVLLTRGPAEHTTAVRLAVLLLGTHLGITGALLGGWPHGQTWWVDQDGHTHTANTAAPIGARLCVLTPTATADLLTLLRQARPAPEHPSPPEPPTPPPQPVRPAVATLASGGASLTPRPPTPHPPGPAAPHGPATAAVPLRLRLRLLGTPALHHTGDTGAPVAIQRSAALQILIFLAVHRRGAVSNQLIAALWPGPRPEGAAERLYTPVSKLRATLRAAAGTDVLIRDGDRYRLDEAHIDVDLWRLHTAVDRAATALDPAERRHALHAVTDAYTGDLAAGKDWAWLAAPREATRRHVVDAYVALAGDEPDPRTALALLQHALSVDPVNADLQRQAQQAHTRAATSP